ncbi:MAG: nucleotidyltransferase [Alphaproteobacteria bacterium]|nr:nucleotidyltransferase [Alphaproteobacteria bacterium]
MPRRATKPSRALAPHGARLRALARRHHLRNLRVFGSVARGEDRVGSDLDLLVDGVSGRTTYFDIAAFKLAAEALLGVAVDVRTLGAISTARRDEIAQEARRV